MFIIVTMPFVHTVVRQAAMYQMLHCVSVVRQGIMYQMLHCVSVVRQATMYQMLRLSVL